MDSKILKNICNEIILNLPPESRLIGNLFGDTGVNHFSEDILYVEMPNGVCIDLGWYPDDDPTGEFRIHVFNETWNNVISRHTAKDASVVAKLIEDLAWSNSSTSRYQCLTCGECERPIQQGDKLRAVFNLKTQSFCALCKDCITSLPADHESIIPSLLVLHYAVADVNLNGSYTFNQFTLADQICYFETRMVRDHLSHLYEKLEGKSCQQ